MGGTLEMKDALEYKKKLEKDSFDGSRTERSLDILNLLADMKVSKKVLIDSQIGSTVKNMRKHSDSKVAEKAGEITKAWREMIAKMESNPTTPKDHSKEDKKEEKKEAKKEEKKVEKKEPPKADVGDKRTKVRKLLGSALTTSDGLDPEKAQLLADRIEDALSSHFGSDEKAYTEKVKSLKFNLTDPKNPDFRSRVCSGEIAPNQIPTLNSSQMAGREKIEAKKANWEAATFQDQMFITAQNLGASSDLFACPKCKKRDCTFYQKQTRSADEPMTVFLTCKSCGNEWRDGG